MSDSECPECGEPEMIFYRGEWFKEDDYREPDAYGCAECGYTEVLW
ncbi:hypothetical protein ISF9_049 [Microbacterium phage vB_MoxS-ISF9]|uniref:Uncharacterized protein n=1 Tax=Microbacterium phage vB_MoxS-ISF9 TaxID=1458670 RepID=W8NNX8_9CAUD|nr:hypothetical protein ISF9_049 [Microbacterium phage vB_MoxS-ISF9]AHL18519.1 hypothetical protein ISF9_049 [Microbacterium phage vB_MoxS-ISF9]